MLPVPTNQYAAFLIGMKPYMKTFARERSDNHSWPNTSTRSPFIVHSAGHSSTGIAKGVKAAWSNVLWNESLRIVPKGT